MKYTQIFIIITQHIDSQSSTILILISDKYFASPASIHNIPQVLDHTAKPPRGILCKAHDWSPIDQSLSGIDSHPQYTSGARSHSKAT